MAEQGKHESWQYNGYADHCEVGREYHEITDSDGFEVINQNGVVGEGAEVEARAALIAAAPDLLAACERVLRATRWSKSEDRLSKQEQADLLRAAIAKATP